MHNLGYKQQQQPFISYKIRALKVTFRSKKQVFCGHVDVGVTETWNANQVENR